MGNGYPSWLTPELAGKMLETLAKERIPSWIKQEGAREYLEEYLKANRGVQGKTAEMLERAMSILKIPTKLKGEKYVRFAIRKEIEIPGSLGDRAYMLKILSEEFGEERELIAQAIWTALARIGRDRRSELEQFLGGHYNPHPILPCIRKIATRIREGGA